MFNLKNQLIYGIIFSIMWWIISHAMNMWPKTILDSSPNSSPVAKSKTIQSASDFLSDLKDIPE